MSFATSCRHALVVGAVACLACVSTTKIDVRVPISEDSQLEPVSGAQMFDGTWTSTDHAVEGRVFFRKACKVHKTEIYKPKIVRERSASVPGNLAWTAVGAGLAGYGVYTLTTLSNHSSQESCNKNESGLETCTSDRDRAQWGGIGLLAIGGVAIAAGLYTMAANHKPVETLGDARKEVSEGKHVVACGNAADLKGARVRMTLPGGVDVTGTLDGDGNVSLPLPEIARFEADKPVPIVVSSLRPARLAFAAGEEAGSVDLGPYVRAQGQQREAALAQADRHEFEGAIHGDDAIKAAFTTQCTPAGNDDCFDAIDNDCDGLYDVGCGYQSGALQWTLAWRTGDDLDLHVIGPDGAHVWYQHKQGGDAGLRLDVDCLGEFGSNCLAQNVENIFTPRDRRPMEGTYRGWVEVYRAVKGDDAGRVVEAMLGGRLAGKTFRMPMRLQAQDNVRLYFAFAIGRDRDKDSVIDRQDACPDQPGVFSHIARELGCPDQDMDGVADLADACPSEAGVRDAAPKKNGCPRTWGHARLTSRGVAIDGTIRFATGSATLLAESRPLLRDVARVMREVPQALQTIRIEGHTDDVGEPDKNYALSRERVKTVWELLVKKEGLDGRRLRTAWFGESRPLPGVDSATEKGRAANRRVEFRVVDPEPTIQLAW